MAAKKRRGKTTKKKGPNPTNKALYSRVNSEATRKFKVYPSAYANAYASKICAGKIKDPSGVKRKDFRGPKPAGKKDGGRINFRGGGICKKGMNKKILRA